MHQMVCIRDRVVLLSRACSRLERLRNKLEAASQRLGAIRRFELVELAELALVVFALNDFIFAVAPYYHSTRSFSSLGGIQARTPVHWASHVPIKTVSRCQSGPTCIWPISETR